MAILGSNKLSNTKLYVLLCTCNPKLLCLSALHKLSCLLNVMIVMCYNMNITRNLLYTFSIYCNIFLKVNCESTLSNRATNYVTWIFILMCKYSHCTIIVCECECVVTFAYIIISSLPYFHLFYISNKGT